MNDHYTLDVSKWVCGNPCWNPNPTTKHGQGLTHMLNVEGYMCCLGQFALQKGLNKLDLLERGDPEDVQRNTFDLIHLNDLYDANFLEMDEGQVKVTKLARDAITINDDDTYTLTDRVEALKNLLSAHNITLEVINMEEK